MKTFSHRWATYCTAFLVCFAAVAAEQPPTLRLPDTIAPTSYRVDLHLDPAKNDFAGSVNIEVTLTAPAQTIWLNANRITVQTAALSAQGKSFPAQVLPGGDDFLGLQFGSPIPAGKAEINISYTGVIRHGASAGVFEMEDGGERYLFTQFESTDARDAFPCFDEPSFKVPWQLTLHVPSADQAVSNTPIISQTAVGLETTYVFNQTKPLPSYLVAFGVGPFEFVAAGAAGKRHAPVRIVTPKGKANEAKYAAEVTATILTRLEDYFGVPFPYEKSDQVAIPVTFGFGAMENAGMVTYAQTLILAKPESDTVNRQRQYASVAAHELAHQWFGDLVTTAWWNDIWLNEAFATWTEQKILAEWKPEWQTRVADVNSKLGAEEEDSLMSARKIRQEIKAKDDISNAFDGITYQKGAAVIGMFESWMGPEDFRKGVHSYVTQYAFKNATAPEFLDSLSSASKKNVTQAFSTFLNQAGVPLVSVALECKQNVPVLHLEQRRYLPLGSKGSDRQIWSIPFCVRYGTGDTGQRECTELTQASTDWTLKAKSCPAWVQANDNAVGYYRVDYQGGLLNALTAGDVQRRLTAAERVDFMGNAQSLASGGKLPMGDALALVETFHADPEWHAVQRAVDVALDARSQLVPESLMPNYRRFLLKNFQARATALGWTPKPGEPDDARLLRPSLLLAVATWGGDQALANQAKELAAQWFTDHSAIDPNVTGAVLTTAAFYGDKQLSERFVAEFKKSTDRQVRRRILTAMQAFRDPAAIEAGFNEVLSGDIPFIEGSQLLLAGRGQDSTRKLAFEFMQAHFDELAAKRPQGGGFDAGARFPAVGSSFCDVESKSQLQSFFEPKIVQFTGGPRAMAQILEGIDLCIATKAAQEPSVVSFLQKF